MPRDVEGMAGGHRELKRTWITRLAPESEVDVDRAASLPVIVEETESTPPAPLIYARPVLGPHSGLAGAN